MKNTNTYKITSSKLRKKIYIYDEDKNQEVYLGYENIKSSKLDHIGIN
jgi:hypothetical protein